MVHWDDAYGELIAGNYNDAFERMLEWWLKKDTAFVFIEGIHSEDDKLYIPWWFGLGCWTYSVAGICMMLSPRPKWTYRSNFCFDLYASILIFVQSPLSFMADYMNMTNVSIWHMIDRFFASPMFVLTSIMLLCTHTSVKKVNTLMLSLDIIAFGFALCSFAASQSAQAKTDKESFIFWHHMWHMYPLFKIVIYTVDLYVFDGLPNMEELRMKRNERRPMLLSTFLLCGFTGDASKKVE